MMSKNDSRLSTAFFSLLFTYILAFLFESQVFYSLADYYDIPENTNYMLSAILAHLAGLALCGFLPGSFLSARKVILIATSVCTIGTIPFFFYSPIWLLGVSLVIGSFVSGCAVAAWGYYLKTCHAKGKRLKACADVLIYSNILMTIFFTTSFYISPHIALYLCLVTIISAGVCAYFLPEPTQDENVVPVQETKILVKAPLTVLMVFVIILTINSGLMYQVFNPAFSTFDYLDCWYWALPYIVALLIMRNIPQKVKRAYVLYVGMGMIILAFMMFMFMSLSMTEYFLVDTFMLGACGIFDLFWWSILAEILEYSKRPTRIFGFGLAANVLGVLLGDLLGTGMKEMKLPDERIAVVALSVVCITMAILPYLNMLLVRLLKEHDYLIDLWQPPEQEENPGEVPVMVTSNVPLTAREEEVLSLILKAKSNKSIGGKLFISESTVKTHVKNIFTKYDVSSRAELMRKLLNNNAEKSV